MHKKQLDGAIVCTPSQIPRPHFFYVAERSENNVALLLITRGRRFACRISLILAKSSKTQFHNIITITVEESIYCILRGKSMSCPICLFAHGPV